MSGREHIELQVRSVTQAPGHFPWKPRWVMHGEDSQGRHLHGTVPAGATVGPGNRVAFEARVRVVRRVGASVYEFVNPRGFRHVRAS